MEHSCQLTFIVARGVVAIVKPRVSANNVNYFQIH